MAKKTLAGIRCDVFPYVTNLTDGVLCHEQINMDFLPQEGVTFPDENTTAAAPPYTPHPEHLTQAAVEPLSRATVRPEVSVIKFIYRRHQLTV